MDETRTSSPSQSDGAWVPGWGKRWKPVDYLALIVIGILAVIVFHGATNSWFEAALISFLLVAVALAVRLWRVKRVEAERS